MYIDWHRCTKKSTITIRKQSGTISGTSLKKGGDWELPLSMLLGHFVLPQVHFEQLPTLPRAPHPKRRSTEDQEVPEEVPKLGKIRKIRKINRRPRLPLHSGLSFWTCSLLPQLVPTLFAQKHHWRSSWNSWNVSFPAKFSAGSWGIFLPHLPKVVTSEELHSLENWKCFCLMKKQTWEIWGHVGKYGNNLAQIEKSDSQACIWPFL